jgi:hypothetical protein
VNDEQTATTTGATTEALPDDANDLRSRHFRELLSKPSTWVATMVFVIAAGIAGASFLSAMIGAIAFVAALVLSLLIVFAIADRRSEADFFAAYAGQRGMSLSGRGPLPPATPLLRKGDERHADEVLSGPLGDGIDGTLALYTYTDVYYDKNGRQETDYHFTIAMTELPACVRFVPELYCNRKSGFRFMEGVEDAFRSMERVHLESDALEDHYEIFVSKQQDQNWIRQLFSPTFIVWLTDTAPEKFAFELDAGVLCCNVKGHKKDAAHLDLMRATATSVAQRIREEVGE